MAQGKSIANESSSKEMPLSILLFRPGAYPIKSTMGTNGKILESHIRTPSQFSIRGRTKFGDPNARAISKTAASEPGYVIHGCCIDVVGSGF